MNQRLHLRVLGAVMLFLIVLLALYFGGVFAQVELAVLDRAAQTNARLHCCAGPHYARSPQLQAEAADDCPRSLRMLRWISRGLSESAAQARQILGGNCPTGTGAMAWSETPAPQAPPLPVAPVAAPGDAGVASAAAPAGADESEEPVSQLREDLGDGDTWWLARWWLKPGEIRCQEFPPRCGEQACPAFSAGALSAAVDLPPEERATLLRAWLCDTQSAKPVRVALERAADVLRAALPALVPKREPDKEAPGESAGDPILPAAASSADAGGSAPEAVAAQRLLCDLPWVSLLGEKELLERLQCPECKRFDPGGDFQDPEQCESPGSTRIVSRVCALGYTQALEPFADPPTPDVEECSGKSRAANGAALDAAKERELEHARDVIRHVARRDPPLADGQWKELVSASFLLDYSELKPVRGPNSKAYASEAADNEATVVQCHSAPCPSGPSRLRLRIRPLLAAAAVPKGVDLSKLPEAPLRTLGVHLGKDGAESGKVVVVCDTAADNTAARRALLWVAGERITALEAPHIDQGGNDCCGELEALSCDEIIDAVDLDHDDQPEVLIARQEHYYSAKELHVITASDPPILRGSVSQRSYASPSAGTAAGPPVDRGSVTPEANAPPFVK